MPWCPPTLPPSNTKDFQSPSRWHVYPNSGRVQNGVHIGIHRMQDASSLDSTINTKPVCESVIKSTMQTICFIIQHLMQVENYLTNQILLPAGNLYRQSKAFWDQWNRWRYLFWPFGFLWGQNAVLTTSIRPQTTVLKPFSQLEVQCSTVHFFATKHCRDIPL